MDCLLHMNPQSAQQSSQGAAGWVYQSMHTYISDSLHDEDCQCVIEAKHLLNTAKVQDLSTPEQQHHTPTTQVAYMSLQLHSDLVIQHRAIFAGRKP